MMYETDNLRIAATQELIPAATLLDEYPLSKEASATVYNTRSAIADILNGDDDRLLVVVGPCSIHNVEAALEYAQLLKAARREFHRELLVVMRVYFEKPRTTIGWKGLINDPDLDDSFKINKGIRLARDLLLKLAADDIPAGVEFLDLISPQYFADLVSWGAIGARTTESQGHRELASGLSCPVGFKNGTGGSIKVAVDAVGAAHHRHSFLSLTKAGRSAVGGLAASRDTHITVRGGSNGPNYDTDSCAAAVALLEKANLPGRVMFDCSHANSRKQHKKQIEVGRDVAGQIAAGSRAIFGVMIESHLKEGNQKLVPGVEPEYGKSITDTCMHWDDTWTVLSGLAEAVRQRRDITNGNDD